jgi:lipoprotein-anchoring transpeptidase ErfK/SrfK
MRRAPSAVGAGAGSRRPRRLAAAAALAAPLLVAGCGGGGRPAPTTTTAVAPTTTAAARTTTHATRPRAQAVPTGEAIVATAIGRSVRVYATPAGKPVTTLANPRENGTPLVFLVRSRRPGWDRVYLPLRPDGSTGWVRERDVHLALTPYSLEVRLGAHEVILRNRTRVIRRIPAGVGRGVLPTPTGRYYIVELLKQPDPNGAYGPYAFGLSAFSKVLYSFGGGPGQIGIHGTDEPTSIGRNASHGCIRIPNRDVRMLAATLPLGTPVTITR